MIRLRMGALLCIGALVASAQELSELEKKVTDFRLPNGLHFILLERHDVPVVSFHTYVNAGSAEDPAGKSGLASLIARLAFDGTESIGTKNWGAEKKALEDVEAAYDREDEERNKGSKADPGRIAILHADMVAALGVAYPLQNPDEYTRAMRENGGAGMESHTTPDSIETSYNLPSNRVELWFAMESQRLAHPVFRNFFRAREALQGDADHLLTSTSPERLRISLASTAFEDLPYRNPPLGRPSDIATLRPADARNFLATYGGPGNTIISIVGDIDPLTAHTLAEKYFGPIPSRSEPPSMRTTESKQLGPKSVALWGNTRPVLLIGYKRPPETDRDDAALDAVAIILGDNPSGWLHRDLVEKKHIADGVDAISDFPSARYVNLFLVTVTAAKDHTVDENRKAVEAAVNRLQSMPLDDETLARAKNILRWRYLRLLGSNQRLAALLPDFYANYGDWHKLFAVGSAYSQLTADDVRRVAVQYLTPGTRTIAYATQAGGEQ